MISRFIKSTWHVLKATYGNLNDNDLTRIAASTAFYTTFAIPPIIMILVKTLGLFISKRAVGQAMLEPLDKLFGAESLASILKNISSFQQMENNYVLKAGVFIFLLFVATSLFKGIRRSIDQLWCIRTVPGRSFISIVKSRAIALAVILVGGMLFLAMQIFDLEQYVLREWLDASGTPWAVFISKAISTTASTIVAILWFYMLFILLPDGRPSRRVTMAGAAITSILFTIGKGFLSVLLKPVQVNNFYGVSGAIVLVLLFTFYASTFLYFGAALIRAVGDELGLRIEPKECAERYRIERDDR